ncbi:MAG: Ni/Fe-hydrogenase, b-type cytochrome subunit [Proteobacteria bacterium]|nr:Ni/Fe-hydrogenase, b-type cytochrome subunit [Pseudomonadota bacterium]
MSKMYHPSTPVANRVREGHFGEAILPPAGVLSGPVYVYDAAIRIWHWVTALCIVVLAITGYFIGAPPPSLGGAETTGHFLFGYIRFVHFSAGMILGVMFLLRIYRVLLGGPHARQIFYVPFWSFAWWKDLFGEVGWYLFLKPPKEYIGHNPLAHAAMFFMFLLPLLVLLLTGFALFSEAMGVTSGWYTVFGWVFKVFGDSMTVHTWHQGAMWVILIFSMVHMYMAIREDMTHRQTTISSMVSGWRFYR